VTTLPSEPNQRSETIQQATLRLKNLFVAAGVPDAGTDARWLLAAALGVAPAHLIAHPTAAIAPAERARLDQFLARRINREPVARILGQREFYGRAFEVSLAVLDPRPDTETVIDVVLELVKSNTSSAASAHPLRILDVGTGSGAILVTLLAELPNATGVGIDISNDALSVAKRNAAALGVEARASFTKVDMRRGLPLGFDIVVANPPYIPSRELAGLSPEVSRFDPLIALDGGTDGLEYYRAILAALADSGAKSDWPRLTLFEVGAGQAGAVSHLLQAQRVPNSQIIERRDLAGHVRCVGLTTQF
jgi:release factor glutamine methyltransferase